MVFVPKNLTFHALLVMMHEIFSVESNRFVYELIYLFNTDSRVARLKIKIDRYLHYMLVEANVNPKAYVTIQQF